METENRLTQWVKEKIEKEYREDIALLIAVAGHATNGDGHGECFDYYVPAGERGNELAQTFIIDGVGHDLYPRSWERMERTANLEEFPTLCLASSKILYARTPEDAERFLALKRKLSENLKNPGLMYQKALERVDMAMDIYRTLLFEEKFYKCRMAAGYIQSLLTQAAAFMNQTFADSGIFSEKQALLADEESRMYHCPGLKEVPEKFYVYSQQLLRADTMEEIRELIYLLIQSVRKFLQQRRPEETGEKKEINYAQLAGWYEEMSLTWRRIRCFCQENMAEEAFHDAVYLQTELVVAAEEFGFEEMDLLSAFDPDCLEKLSRQSGELEKAVRSVILEHGGKINEYRSLEDFLSRSEKKDAE